MGTLLPHLRFSTENKVRYALLPGDHARVDRIIPYLQDVRPLAFHREYRSVLGIYKGTEVLALSTGIGGASMGIALEELRLLGLEACIRIGSSGALQPNIALGELIIANGAVRDDGTSRAYAPLAFPALADPSLLSCCVHAAQSHGFVHHVGIVRSHDSFYTEEETGICAEWAARGVLGADMETAALFTIAALRGIRAASILNNVVLSTQDAALGVKQYAQGEDACARGEQAEIETALEAIAAMEARR